MTTKITLSLLIWIIFFWVLMAIAPIDHRVNPELGDAYLGTQGDIWDVQKDTALAGIGSFMAMLVGFTLEKIRK